MTLTKHEYNTHGEEQEFQEFRKIDFEHVGVDWEFCVEKKGIIDLCEKSQVMIYGISLKRFANYAVK